LAVAIFDLLLTPQESSTRNTPRVSNFVIKQRRGPVIQIKFRHQLQHTTASRVKVAFSSFPMAVSVSLLNKTPPSLNVFYFHLLFVFYLGTSNSSAS